MKTVSIIIPTKNAGANFEKTLREWRFQNCNCNIEIVIIDSGSTDNTLLIAEKYNCKIIQIKPQDFQHGRTRNIGINASKGDFLIFTVQDAIPCERNIIQKFLLRFEQDEDLKAINGKQIVPKSEETNPLEWSRCHTKLYFTREFKPKEFKSLPPKRQYEISFWDNVLAVYKRESLENLPFDTVEFGEDIIWAKKALEKGWKLGYDYSCCVCHYHHYTFNRLFNRTFIAFIHTLSYWNFKRRYPFILKPYISVTLKLLFKIKSKKKFYWLIYNYKYWLAKYSALYYFNLLILIKGEKYVKSLITDFKGKF